MKKFKFKLQKLLDFNQQKEDQEKTELAKASMAYQTVLNKKTKLLDTVKNIRKELSGKKNLTLASLQNYDKMTNNTDQAVKALEPVIEEKKKIMQTHIQKFAELRREKRKVEIMKEKAYEQYKLETNREEQKVLDEIGKNIYLNHKEKPEKSEN
jgi:flagellar protein FliJ